MANHRNRFPARRRFLKQSTALTATVVALPLPRLTSAQSQATPPQDGSGGGAPQTTGADPAQAQRRRRSPKQ